MSKCLNYLAMEKRFRDYYL